jgi:cation diffusion facilitator CzcD-associated flavoprotein CzcO
VPEIDPRFDALVIGAGFSGLYAPHRLRELGSIEYPYTERFLNAVIQASLE